MLNNTLFIADAPLINQPIIKEMTPQALSKQLNISWGNTILTENNSYQDKKINARAQKQHSKLVICYKGSAGYGLFAKDFIPKGSVIGAYASKKHQFNSPDEFHQKLQNLSSHYVLMSVGDSGFFDALSHGNATRFINHAPSKQFLKDNYTLSTPLVAQVGTANAGYFHPNSTATVPHIITIEDIHPRQEILIDYELTYWLHLPNQPLLFDQYGIELNPDLYQTSKIHFYLPEIGGGTTIVSDTLCAFGEHKTPMPFNDTLLISVESIKKILEKNHCKFSVHVEFNQLHYAVAETLYLGNDSQIENSENMLLKVIHEHLSNHFAPVQIEYFKRKTSGVYSPYWPIDAILGSSSPEACGAIQNELAKAHVFSVNLDNQYVIIPDVTSQHMSQCLIKLMQALDHSPTKTHFSSETSIQKLREYIQEQKKLHVSATVLSQKGPSLFTADSQTTFSTLEKIIPIDHKKALQHINIILSELPKKHVNQPDQYKINLAKWLTLRAKCHRAQNDLPSAIADCELAIKIYIEKKDKPFQSGLIETELQKTQEQLNSYHKRLAATSKQPATNKRMMK